MDDKYLFFSEWLEQKYGIGHDDLTDEDYDRYYAEYQDEKLMNKEYKTYDVPIIGGFTPYYRVTALNKTMARKIAQGEVCYGIKVKGKIIEVKDDEQKR